MKAAKKAIDIIKLEKDLTGSSVPRYCREKHKLKFRFQSSEDEADQFFICAACSEEIDPLLGFYYCDICKTEICQLCSLHPFRAEDY